MFKEAVIATIGDDNIVGEMANWHSTLHHLASVAERTHIATASKNSDLGTAAKPTTHAAIDALKADGIHVVMLTGDNKTTAEAVARKLGITE